MSKNINIVQLKDSSNDKVYPITTANQVMMDYQGEMPLKQKVNEIDESIALLEITTQKVKQSITSADGEFPVLISSLPISSGSLKSTSIVNYSQKVLMNPFTGELKANIFDGNLTGNADSATKATQDASGNVIIDTYETKTDATSKLSEAKTYADSVGATIKNDLLNGAGTAYDTLKELGDLIDDNVDAISALEAITTSKADKTHTHAISDVTNLQSTLNAKLPNTTTYAGSDTIGGAATSAKKISITRVTSAITDIAANIPTNTEAIYFCGSDGLTYGCPKTYCIINIKKGDNHRTIMDCYHLNTGDHYINGCMDTRDTTANPWTGWKLQPNDTTINTINNAISNLQTISNTHETKTDATAKLNEAKSYTDTKVSDLTTRLNTLADSDDTTLDQLSEIVTYIKSNKSLIDSVTTSKADKEHTHYTSEIYDDNDYEVLKGNALDSIINSIDVELFNMAYTVTNVNNSMQNKVNVSDIIDNLITNVSNKPLSAAQGVVIKGLIDALESALNTHKSDTTVHITSEERTKWNNASTHANSNHVTGIKGNAESSYRTGEVNITPANIGLDKVDNTSDIDKPVSTAQEFAINSCSVEAKEFTRLNTYKSFIFQNSQVSVLADQPEDPNNLITEVIAGSDEKSNNMYYHKLKFIAADNRISFSTHNSDAFNEGIIDKDEIDQVYITVNADPEGSADAALDAAKSHTNSSLKNYYNKEQIDDLELITVEDIDAICGTTIIVADDEVKF